MKKPKTLYIRSVKAIPLKKLETVVDHPATEYTMRYKKSLRFQYDGELTASLLKKIAFGTFKSSMVSYKYKDGDQTFFEVNYKNKSTGQPYKYAFVSGVR